MSPRAKRYAMGVILLAFGLLMLAVTSFLGFIAYFLAWCQMERAAVGMFACALCPVLLIGIVAGLAREEFAKLRRMEASERARTLFQQELEQDLRRCREHA